MGRIGIANGSGIWLVHPLKLFDGNDDVPGSGLRVDQFDSIACASVQSTSNLFRHWQLHCILLGIEQLTNFNRRNGTVTTK